MRKKHKKFLRNLILIVIVIGGFGLFITKFNKSKLEVKNWDNIYNENNINIYYGDTKSSKIKALDNVYRVNELAGIEESEINKALKVVDIVNTIVEFDDVSNSKRINGFDILEEKATQKKVSQRDMAIITRDLLLTMDIKARVGEFREINKRSGEARSYYVAEYWSKEHSKWIMIDFRDRGYIENAGVPCSAIEIMGNLDKAMNYIGKSESKKYIKEFKKVTQTYTINIDSSTDMLKSNSYITFIKDPKYINIKLKNKHIPPTVFTQNADLFKKDPENNNIGIDEKAYIILMEKDYANAEADIKSKKYIIGAFKDGKIMDKYYIRKNNEDFIEVNKYSELELVNGNNILEISIDGKNKVGFIEIEYRQ